MQFTLFFLLAVSLSCFSLVPSAAAELDSHAESRVSKKRPLVSLQKGQVPAWKKVPGKNGYLQFSILCKRIWRDNRFSNLIPLATHQFRTISFNSPPSGMVEINLDEEFTKAPEIAGLEYKIKVAKLGLDRLQKLSSRLLDASRYLDKGISPENTEQYFIPSDLLSIIDDGIQKQTQEVLVDQLKIQDLLKSPGYDANNIESGEVRQVWSRFLSLRQAVSQTLMFVNPQAWNNGITSKGLIQGHQERLASLEEELKAAKIERDKSKEALGNRVAAFLDLYPNTQFILKTSGECGQYLGPKLDRIVNGRGATYFDPTPFE